MKPEKVEEILEIRYSEITDQDIHSSGTARPVSEDEAEISGAWYYKCYLISATKCADLMAIMQSKSVKFSLIFGKSSTSKTNALLQID